MDERQQGLQHPESGIWMIISWGCKLDTLVSVSVCRWQSEGVQPRDSNGVVLFLHQNLKVLTLPGVSICTGNCFLHKHEYT